MKKHIILVVGLLLLLLTGCRVQNGDEKTPQIHHYTVKGSNFESFYDVAYQLEMKADRTYEMNLTIMPKMIFETNALDVTFFITVTRIDHPINFDIVYEIQVSDEDLAEGYKISKTGSQGIHAYISKFDVFVRSGFLKSTDEITTTTQNYPLIFDTPDTSKIYIADFKQNNLNYNEFMTLLDTYDNESSNHLTITTNQTLKWSNFLTNHTESSQSVKQIQLEPFYITSTIDDHATKIVHLLETRDDYVLFRLDDNMMIDNQYIVDPIFISPNHIFDVLKSMDINEDNTFNEGYLFDPMLMSFMATPNGFVVEAFLKDYVTKDMYDAMVLAYELQGLNTDILDEVRVFLTLTKEGLVYKFETKMNFHFYGSEVLVMSHQVTSTMDFSPFVPVYITDDNIHVRSS